MDGCTIFVIVHFMISAVHVVYGNIENSLDYWETLSFSKIQRRIIKRDSESQHPLQQRIKFDSYGQHFSLVLRKDNSIISPDFQVLVMDADGKETEFKPDINLYRGSVEGDPNSFVRAYLHDDGILSAAFKTSTDFYMVEPAWNLLPNASHDTMIIYRNSDLKWGNNSFCGYVDPDKNTNETFMSDLTFSPDYSIEEPDQKAAKRSKRTTCTGKNTNTCHLYLVIDPLFFANVGDKNTLSSVMYVLSDLDRVDGIYRQTEFKGCDTGYGFEVKRIRVFPQTTAGYSFTIPKTYETRDLLSKFAEDSELANYCLGHLYTYQTLQHDGYVLGLGYIGSPKTYTVGGICSHDGDRNYNAAYTTFYSYTRNPAMQSLLVTTHEMGHNWGSPHDESPAECTPDSSNGGKFIMYPISVSGSDKNNWIFSPCSRSAIGAVLAKKSDCFALKRKTFCGNYVVEDKAGEECDPGFTSAVGGSTSADPCCDNNCMLKSSAKCSDLNSHCCKKCQFAAANVVCLPSAPGSCTLASVCDGTSAVCPPGLPKPPNTPCINNGLCVGIECKSLCQVNNLDDCLCDKEKKDYCTLCCLNSQKQCLPFLYKGKTYNTSEGFPCTLGSCNAEGLCIPMGGRDTFRLWAILDISSPAGFVRFMRNNIVTTVIIASLLLWIPCGCFVCYLDRRYDREQEEMIEDLVDEHLDERHVDDIHPEVHTEGGGGHHTRKQKRNEVEKTKMRAIVRKVEEEPDDDEASEDSGSKVLSAKFDPKSNTTSVSTSWSKH